MTLKALVSTCISPRQRHTSKQTVSHLIIDLVSLPYACFVGSLLMTAVMWSQPHRRKNCLSFSFFAHNRRPDENDETKIFRRRNTSRLGRRKKRGGADVTILVAVWALFHGMAKGYLPVVDLSSLPFRELLHTVFVIFAMCWEDCRIHLNWTFER